MKTNALVDAVRRMNPDISKGQAIVYFLQLTSGVIYIGSTTDLEQRLDDHLAGHACRTTQLDPPLALLRIEVLPTFSEARRREVQLKRRSQAKKEALIKGRLGLLKEMSRSRD